MPIKTLTEKKVTAFNQEIFKKGYLITYCFMVRENFTSMAAVNGGPINGVIKSVDDDKMEVINRYGAIETMFIKNIENPERYDFDMPKFKILGVAENLIDKEDAE